jgi:hypothetical protein
MIFPVFFKVWIRMYYFFWTLITCKRTELPDLGWKLIMVSYRALRIARQEPEQVKKSFYFKFVSIDGYHPVYIAIILRNIHIRFKYQVID